MSEIEPARSPFDAIRHVDEQGGEFWYARELQPLLGYSVWRDFANAIGRAKVACSNSGADPDQHFADARKINDQGYKAEDYRLTRYAAYLAAMNSDPRKAPIAKAQTYFAIKTREAETAPTVQVVPQWNIPQTYAAALELAATQAREIEAKDQEIEEQRAQLDWAEPRAAYVDRFVDGAGDANTIRDTAKQLEVPERKFYAWLIDRGLIYKLPSGEYRPRAMLGPRRHWFVLKDQPEAPRYHNGQVRKTLYVTPAGKTGIEALLAKYPILGQGELDIDEDTA